MSGVNGRDVRKHSKTPAMSGTHSVSLPWKGKFFPYLRSCLGHTKQYSFVQPARDAYGQRVFLFSHLFPPKPNDIET